MGLDGNGQPYYTLTQGHEPIIGKSTSGMRFKDGSLNRDFRILKTATASKDETWNEPWGEETSVRNHYNELAVALRQRSGQHRLLTLVFSVFDDGIGFRLCVPRIAYVEGFYHHGRGDTVCLSLQCTHLVLPLGRCLL